MPAFAIDYRGPQIKRKDIMGWMEKKMLSVSINLDNVSSTRMRVVTFEAFYFCPICDQVSQPVLVCTCTLRWQTPLITDLTESGTSLKVRIIKIKILSLVLSSFRLVVLCNSEITSGPRQRGKKQTSVNTSELLRWKKLEPHRNGIARTIRYSFSYWWVRENSWQVVLHTQAQCLCGAF